MNRCSEMQQSSADPFLQGKNLLLQQMMEKTIHESRAASLPCLPQQIRPVERAALGMIHEIGMNRISPPEPKPLARAMGAATTSCPEGSGSGTWQVAPGIEMHVGKRCQHRPAYS